MGFWDENAKREAEIKASERLPQDAPMECAFCGHFCSCVMLAVCASCEPPSRSGESS